MTNPEKAPEAKSPPSIVLTLAELVELTRYKRASDQLRELHERGFNRAYIRAGAVLLERAHYEAVCRGEVVREKPRIIPPRLIRPGGDR